MTDYVEKLKEYTAVQWNGTNDSAVAAIVGPGITSGYKSLDGQQLLFVNNYNNQTVQVFMNSWVVAQKRQDGQEGYIWPAEVWDDTTFNGKYEEE
jgi:hypothetical protein